MKQSKIKCYCAESLTGEELPCAEHDLCVLMRPPAPGGPGSLARSVTFHGPQSPSTAAGQTEPRPSELKTHGLVNQASQPATSVQQWEGSPSEVGDISAGTPVLQA